MPYQTALPNSKYINTNLGLKYLNGNKKLYNKVLKSFLIRYQFLELDKLNNEKFTSTIHTIKGLSLTLGMEKLSLLSTQLHQKKNEQSLKEFSEVLSIIISDLTKI
ncbi:MAG: SENSORY TRANSDUCTION HISTIDINE KINASE [uncultured Sulfurovum sp.]|uniref:SENSORY TRANSDUCTION HISTIDINE KINASE n=1 Tax=uncultured Sulfurovum sp. TaxID=269237 RepID=A0A6S6SUC3_9BACT|nr:MAG: SENSORY TRANSDUCTION HISTIDINE KINASE [uncultured Sulfurovum sp.]